MKTSKFSEEQVALALRQVEGGAAVTEVCRRLGVTELSDCRRLSPSSSGRERTTKVQYTLAPGRTKVVCYRKEAPLCLLRSLS